MIIIFNCELSFRPNNNNNKQVNNFHRKVNLISILQLNERISKGNFAPDILYLHIYKYNI